MSVKGSGPINVIDVIGRIGEPIQVIVNNEPVCQVASNSTTADAINVKILILMIHRQTKVIDSLNRQIAVMANDIGRLQKHVTDIMDRVEFIPGGDQAQIAAEDFRNRVQK